MSDVVTSLKWAPPPVALHTAHWQPESGRRISAGELACLWTTLSFPTRPVAPPLMIEDARDHTDVGLASQTLNGRSCRHEQGADEQTRRRAQPVI